MWIASRHPINSPTFSSWSSPIICITDFIIKILQSKKLEIILDFISTLYLILQQIIFTLPPKRNPNLVKVTLITQLDYYNWLFFLCLCPYPPQSTHCSATRVSLLKWSVIWDIPQNLLVAFHLTQTSSRSLFSGLHSPMWSDLLYLLTSSLTHLSSTPSAPLHCPCCS
jgi:hypothetical protein